MRAACAAGAALYGLRGTDGSEHGTADRLLFFHSVTLGLYRPRDVRGACEEPRLQGRLQAGVPRRIVRGDRRPATRKTSPGASALSHDGIAALAREARLELSFEAAALAVRPETRRLRRDRGDRSRAQSRAVHALDVQEHLGGAAEPRRGGDRHRSCQQGGAAGRAVGCARTPRARSPRSTNRTGRTRSQPTCSARRATCSTARSSGGRTASSSSATR